MVVYIPNSIYDECKIKNETLEEFIREVFKEWTDDYINPNLIVDRAINQIFIIDDKCVLDN